MLATAAAIFAGGNRLSRRAEVVCLARDRERERDEREQAHAASVSRARALRNAREARQGSGAGDAK